VGFGVDNLALVQVFLRADILRFPLPMLYTHLSPALDLRQHHVTSTWRAVCWDCTLNQNLAGLTVKIFSCLETTKIGNSFFFCHFFAKELNKKICLKWNFKAPKHLFPFTSYELLNINPTQYVLHV
jgi:hypothetical protein